MLNTTRESLDIRFAAGRLLGITVLTLGLLLAAVGTVRPAAAATTDQVASCIVDIARAKRDISVWVGGDHVGYRFGEKIARATQLCEAGNVSHGRNILAEVKSDLRALRGERGER